MKNTIEQLKQIQADAHALYIKMHNFHWNVKGMDFFPVHNQTEEIYNNMSALFDDTAERVLQLGGKPYITLSQLVQATKIEEETADTFRSKEIVEKIIAEYEYLKESFTQLSEVAQNDGDTTTQTFADDNIAKLEKDLWMLGNMVQ